MKRNKDFFRGFSVGICVFGTVAAIMLIAFWIFL